MLSPDDLATIRAALRFWRDEMVLADIETVRHYADDECLPQTDSVAVAELIEQFHSDQVRYVTCHDEFINAQELSTEPPKTSSEKMIRTVI